MTESVSAPSSLTLPIPPALGSVQLSADPAASHLILVRARGRDLLFHRLKNRTVNCSRDCGSHLSLCRPGSA